MMMEYAEWLRSRTEQDSLDDFLEDFYIDLDNDEMIREIVYELYMLAKAYGDTQMQLDELRTKLNEVQSGQANQKDRDREQEGNEKPKKARKS